MAGGRIFHWKHGWIPLDKAATEKTYVADFVGGVPLMGTVRVPPGSKVIKKPKKKFKPRDDTQMYVAGFVGGVPIMGGVRKNTAAEADAAWLEKERKRLGVKPGPRW